MTITGTKLGVLKNFNQLCNRYYSMISIDKTDLHGTEANKILHQGGGVTELHRSRQATAHHAKHSISTDKAIGSGDECDPLRPHRQAGIPDGSGIRIFTVRQTNDKRHRNGHAKIAGFAGNQERDTFISASNCFIC